MSSFVRLLVAAFTLTAVAAPVSAMGQRPAATPAPASPEPGAAARIADVEAAAGRVIYLGPRLEFQTAKGTFTVVTFPRQAPRSVDRFVTLVRERFYDNLAFHRVVPGFVAQVGDPKTRELPIDDPRVGAGGSGTRLPAEFRGQSLKHLAGTVAIARGSDPESGDSQFYITFGPVPHLNGQYTVVGHVVAGMDVVRRLERGDRIEAARVR